MSRKFTCLIVDDAIPEGLALKTLIDKTDFLEFDRLITNPLQAFDYLQENEPDILFLDIEMPQLTGIELLKSLPKRPSTILVTSHTEFALEAYDLDVIDYLIKPVSYPRFLKTTAKIAEIKKKTSNVSKDFFVKVDSKYVRLNEADILYIEGLKDYVVIHTNDQRSYITYSSLKHIEEQLKELFQDIFIRVHRSFIININKIDFVEETQVHLQGVPVSIGATYRQYFFSLMNKI